MFGCSVFFFIYLVEKKLKNITTEYTGVINRQEITEQPNISPKPAYRLSLAIRLVAEQHRTS